MKKAKLILPFLLYLALKAQTKPNSTSVIHNLESDNPKSTTSANNYTFYNLSYIQDIKIKKQDLKPISFKNMYKKLKKSKIILLADIHPSAKLHKKMIEIIKNIYSKNTAVGLEFFKISDQKFVNAYINNTLSLEELLSEISYDKERMEKLGYSQILKFLKKNKIPFFGIDMPYAIIEKQSPTTITIQLYNPYNFYQRDLLAASLTKTLVKKGKQTILIIGMKHTYPNHLPKLIKQKTNLDSIIVSPFPLDSNLDLKENTAYQNKTYPFNFTFFINIKPTQEEINYYFNKK